MLYPIPIFSSDYEDPMDWLPDERPALHFTSWGADEMAQEQPSPEQPPKRRRARAAVVVDDCGCAGKAVKHA